MSQSEALRPLSPDQLSISPTSKSVLSSVSRGNQNDEKIFGMENFGNTCYANSVLQCLFANANFRKHILDISPVDWQSRRSTPGKSKHQFVVEAENTRYGSSGSMLRKLKKDKPIFGDEQRLNGLEVGPRALGQGTPIVGYTDDANATPEAKKRAALLKGPIVNVDHSLASDYGMDASLLTAVKDVFECVEGNSSRTGVTSPSALVELLKRENDLFKSSMHQDAHEFYSFLINQIIEKLDAMKADSAWIHQMFEGMLTNELRCMTCETISTRDEKFLDLSLDIENNTSISQCMRQFSASEVLNGRNKFYCDICQGLQEAHKRMKVRVAPEVLTLHLKRFKYSEQHNTNTKLQYRVQYSKYLRLPVVSKDNPEPDALYELSSVVLHLGGGPYQGHYVAVVKTEKAGWLLFDDECVEAVDENYVFKFFGDSTRMATAYVLFYNKTTQQQFEKDNLFINPDVTTMPEEQDQDSFTTTSEIASLSPSDDQNGTQRRGSDRRGSDMSGNITSRRRRSTVNSGKSKDSKLLGIFRKASVSRSSGSQASTTVGSDIQRSQSPSSH